MRGRFQARRLVDDLDDGKNDGDDCVDVSGHVLLSITWKALGLCYQRSI